jgi:uncharacterized membrane protein YeaQ/YmgE (transglycosylase-associated protein family)
MGFGGIVGILVTGFLLGAAARWILPGPDPMPLWFTVAIGMTASLVGGGIAAGIFGSKHLTTNRAHIFATLLLEVAVATGVVIAYRRLVQHRGLTGPDARRFPTRGFGIARMRARLREVGIDPEQLPRPGFHVVHRPSPTPPEAAPPASTPPRPTDELEELEDLHEKGILTDEEFEAARKRLYL